MSDAGALDLSPRLHDSPTDEPVVALPPWMADLTREVGVPRREPASQFDVDVDEFAIAVAAELADSAPPGPGGLWRQRRRILPPQVLAFVRSSIRLDFVREIVLAAAEDELVHGVDDRLRDVALLEALWRATCSRGRTQQTIRWLRRIRDRVVRSLHGGSCYRHRTFAKMPGLLKRWKPDGGILTVDDLGGTVPTMGYAPFLEQTPAQLVRYIYETWRTRKLKAAHAFEFGIPGAWDLFGGSGTGSDVLGGLLGCTVIATDLTSCNEAVATLDAREAGSIYEHGGEKLALWEQTDNRVVATPDIVLLDPPSRGTPTHSQIYAGDREAADMGALGRQAWIDTTVELVHRVIPRLGPHGVVSLLVRHGVRDNQRVQPDIYLLNDVKTALGPGVMVIAEIRLEYRIRVRQASLATSRVPSTHLLLGRPT